MLRRLPGLLLLNSLTVDVAVLLGLVLVAGQGSLPYLASRIERLERTLGSAQVVALEKGLGVGSAATGLIRRWDRPDWRSPGILH